MRGRTCQGYPGRSARACPGLGLSDEALRRLEAELVKDSYYRALISTTQAITVSQGGLKANALPEESRAIVNHRIATQRSVFCIYTRDLGLFIRVIHDLGEQLCGRGKTTRY